MFILLLVKPKRHKAEAQPTSPPGSAPGTQILVRSSYQALESLDRRWIAADDGADLVMGMNRERNEWRRRRRRKRDQAKEDAG